MVFATSPSIFANSGFPLTIADRWTCQPTVIVVALFVREGRGRSLEPSRSRDRGAVSARTRRWPGRTAGRTDRSGRGSGRSEGESGMSSSACFMAFSASVTPGAQILAIEHQACRDRRAGAEGPLEFEPGALPVPLPGLANRSQRGVSRAEARIELRGPFRGGHRARHVRLLGSEVGIAVCQAGVGCGEVRIELDGPLEVGMPVCASPFIRCR